MNDRVQRKVLLVDHDRDFIDDERHDLEEAGLHVTEATTSKDALQLLESDNFDLAVVDLRMEYPDSGFTLCYQIKKALPGLPVIMVTGVYADTGIEFDAATAEERSWIKADSVLSKPLRSEQLLREIYRLLGSDEEHENVQHAH